MDISIAVMVGIMLDDTVQADRELIEQLGLLVAQGSDELTVEERIELESHDAVREWKRARRFEESDVVVAAWTGRDHIGTDTQENRFIVGAWLTRNDWTPALSRRFVRDAQLYKWASYRG